MARFVTALLVLLALAGCTQPTVELNLCELGVCPLQETPQDVDLQPDTQAIAGISGPVHGFTATSTGWAWTRLIEGQVWLEHLARDAQQLDRVSLAGPPVTEAVYWDGGSILATSPEPPTLHQWAPGQEPTSIVLTGIDAAVRVVATGESGLVLQSTGLLPKFWLHDTLSQQNTPLQHADGTIVGVALSGAAHYAAVLSDTSTVAMHQWPHGDAFEIWQGADSILGIWADGQNIAFATRDGDVDLLWSIDAKTHEVSPMNLTGLDPVWVANAMHFRGTGEGIDLLQTQTSAGTTHGFNLETGLWAANDNGIWWLDIPRIDHRFVEAANPTDFDYLLVTPA